MAARSRVTLNRPAVHRMVDQTVGPRMETAAALMAAEQRSTTRSRRLRQAVVTEAGRDAQGWYARAGIGKDRRAFFWFFEEFGVGRGDGHPFIRQSLWSNTGVLGRLMIGRR